MSDLRTLIERELERIQPSPFEVGAFHRRRDRRRRTRAIVSGAIALVVALAAIGLVVRAFGADHRLTPAGRGIVPTGSIAFVGRGPGRGPGWRHDGSLFVLDPRTGGVTTLVQLSCSVDQQGVRSCPGFSIEGIDWSPDGTRVAYSLQQNRGWNGRQPLWTLPASAGGIYVLDLRTGVTRQLTHCQNPSCMEGLLDWSPDGSTIAYARSDVGSQSIWMMAPDGSTEARVNTGTYLANDPSWSPDGRQIAFAGAGPTLFTAAPDGSNIRPLNVGVRPGANGHSLWAPAWSPDGTTIAFLERTAGPLGRLWLTRLGSSSAAAISALGSNQELSPPSWSLDGTRIAVVANGWLYVVRADGTGLTKLTRAWSSVAPAWYPG